MPSGEEIYIPPLDTGSTREWNVNIPPLHAQANIEGPDTNCAVVQVFQFKSETVELNLRKA